MAIIAKEIWKPSIGWEGFYEVSDYGRVRSLTRRFVSEKFNKTFHGQLLAPFVNHDGYYVVTLRNKNKVKCCRIHRLVGAAFMPNPKNMPEINHIDGDKSNNIPENLEWCTSSQNKFHSYEIGLIKPQLGSNHGRAKVNEQDVYEIKIMLKKKYTEPFIAKVYNVSRGMVSHIKRETTWSHVQLKTI